MNKKVSLLVVMTILFLIGGPVFSEEILTNENIVTMIKAGLGEQLILSKIKTSGNQFDLSTDAIVKLKNAGVSDSIIVAMITASSKKPATSPTTIPPGISSQQQLIAKIDPGNLYLKKGENILPMLPINAQEERSRKKRVIGHLARVPSVFMGSEDVWHFIRGEKSVVRSNEKKPVFLTKINPSAFLLVNLIYDKEKDIRFAVSSSGVYKNTIPVEFKGSPETYFEIIPKGDLLPGEYAFVASRMFYDFGVDE